MPDSIQKVDIVPKEENAEAYELSCEIKNWLSKKGVQVTLYNHEDYFGDLFSDRESPDLILVLGGDGTILSVARKMSYQEISLLGFNFGHVGFLTELDPNTWREDMNKVLQKEFCISERLILGYQLLRDGMCIQEGKFINDLVVGRGGVASLVDLVLWSGQEKITELRADGLIVSTPLGSTAYSMAAGGPLIAPELEVLELCPICPFLSGMRPIILSSSSIITIKVQPGTQAGFLTLDGQSGMPLNSGDQVRIQRSSNKLQLVHLEKNSYLKKLKAKGYLMSQHSSRENPWGI